MSNQTNVRSSNKLNSSAKLAFYKARRRQGDNTRLSEATGYSESHLSNVTSGTRRVNDTIANAMYALTRRRTKNSDLAKA
jgi:hypothetical protein